MKTELKKYIWKKILQKKFFNQSLFYTDHFYIDNKYQDCKIIKLKKIEDFFQLGSIFKISSENIAALFHNLSFSTKFDFYFNLVETDKDHIVTKIYEQISEINSHLLEPKKIYWIFSLKNSENFKIKTGNKIFIKKDFA